MYLLDHARTIAEALLELVDALAQQGRAHLGAIMPGRTHLQHAQPVLLTHHLLAHAWPLVRDVDRLADWAAGASTRRTARGRWPASRWASTPSRSPRELGFASSSAELDRRHVGAGLRRRVRVHLRPGRRGPQPARRGADPLVDPGVRLRPAARLLVDGVEHHAAEEEPRHRRARPRQGRPADRQPRPGCSRRSRRCRWPTTATCRRTRSRSSTRWTPSRCCCRR